jgi:hypothetical protein
MPRRTTLALTGCNMAAEYRGLGFDPTPGSQDAVRAAGERCRLAAELLDSAAAGAGHVVEESNTWWSGAAAEAFLVRLQRLQPGLGELAAVRDGLRAAEDVLHEWAAVLRANQRTADELDRLALELRHALLAAEDGVRAAGAALQVALGSGVHARQAEHAAAVARRDHVDGELGRVLATARALEREHLRAARGTAQRLRALQARTAQHEPASHPTRGEPPADPPAAELRRFAGVLAALSRRAAELAVTLLGAPGPNVPSGPDGPDGSGGAPRGAAGAFASALAGSADDR